jgi:stage II sporulation protein D
VDPRGRTLRSTFFTLLDEAASVTFVTGRGSGHGMGMCQYGMNPLAEEGAAASAILRFYYPESNLTRAY